MAVAAAALGTRCGVLLPGLQRHPAEDPARRTTAGRQRRRRCGAPGVPARRRACGRGMLVGATFPAVGSVVVAVLLRDRPRAADRDEADREQRLSTKAEARAAAYAARSAGRLRVHAAHAVAAVDAAVREHVRARGAGSHRGAVAVHRQRPVRRWCADVRLHPGVLRDGQRPWRACGVVGTAAPSLSHGDDGDVGRRLHPIGGRRLHDRRSR